LTRARPRATAATHRSPASHQPRSAPRSSGRSGGGSAGGIWLTDRDRWILAAVAENQILTSDHLTALAFTTRRSAQRRLALLTTAGYLERFRPAKTVGSAPAHYLLTASGAQVLIHASGATSTSSPEAGRLPEGGRIPRRLVTTPSMSQLRLAHTLGVADLYVAFATAAQHPPGNPSAAGGLHRWWGERTCTAWWGRYARPDAYGRWHGPDRTGRNQTLDFFLEYDTGTENLARLLAKLDGYQRLADATGITTIVLFHLPSRVREQNLHARLNSRSDGEGNLRAPVATATARTGLAGPVWRTTAASPDGADERCSLADLARHPHTAPAAAPPGSETCGSETSGSGTGGAVQPLPWPPPAPLPPPLNPTSLPQPLGGPGGSGRRDAR
jgi:Replication-relaxation